MKALLCAQHGLPDSLKFEETPSPIINSKEVLIKVAACSVNFPDILIIQNKYQFKPELPFSPGGEVSGKIIAIGSEVKHLKVGQDVFALCSWGGFAEEVAVAANRVFPMIPGIDYVTSASVMYNYGTSYHALKDRAKLQKGETLLVLGAAGGVGLAAVELGKLMGATVIAAASTDEKLVVCKEKGAEYLVNYTKENLKDEIKEITGGKGVDIVYDPVGDKFAEPALRSMAWGGRYLVVGFAGGEIPKIPLNLALLKGCAITGVFWGQFATLEPKNNLINLQELAGYFLKGKIKAHIYKEYTLEESKDALNDLMHRKVIGKAVVICSPEMLKNQPQTKVEVTKIINEEPEIINGKTVFSSKEQVKKFIGKSLGESAWFEVSQEVIDAFAKATHDNQWIHINPEMAKSTPFGTTIAHGLLTLSLSPKFMYEIYEVKNTKMGINYGSDKVRFLKPVLSGSKVKMKASLKEVSEMPNDGLKMIVSANFYIENNEKPVCVADLISVIY